MSALNANTHWHEETLGSLADYQNGRAFKPSDWKESGIPIIRIENLTDPSAPVNYFNGGIEARHRVNSDDLLVSWSATLDVFWWDRGPAVLNQHIFRVSEDRAKVRRDFLYFLLKSVIGELRAQVHGSTMKHITKPKFVAIRAHIPTSQRVQESMAQELRLEVDAAVRAHRALWREHAGVRALLGACVDEALAPHLGELGELGSVLLAPPKAGWSPACDGAPGGTPVLAITSVTGFEFKPSAYKLTSEEVSATADYWAKNGDLFMTRSNTPELVGHVAIARGLVRRTIFPDLLLRLDLDRTRVVPEFVQLWLMGATARKFIKREARGSSGTMKKVTQRIVGRVPFPVDLGLPEQENVIRRLSDIVAAVRRVEASVMTGLEASEQLSTAIVREAFVHDLTDFKT
jgi:type I restriction enzyme S subunit